MSRLQSAPALVRGGLADSLRLTGWVAVNALVAMGGLIVAAFTLGSFSIAGTMHQLANLSDRYVAADVARQSQFDALLLVTLAIFFTSACFFRRHSAIRLFHERIS